MSSSNESAFHAELVDALQEIHQSDLPLFEKMRRFPMGLREDKPYFAYVLSNDDLLRQDVVKSSLARLCNELGFEWCTIRLELYASSEGDSADDWTYADEEEERMVKLLMRRHAELDTRLLCISDDHPCGAHIMPNVGLADLVGAKSLWATDPRRAFEDDAERTSIDGRIHLPFGKTRDGNFEVYHRRVLMFWPKTGRGEVLAETGSLNVFLDEVRRVIAAPSTCTLARCDAILAAVAAGQVPDEHVPAEHLSWIAIASIKWQRPDLFERALQVSEGVPDGTDFLVMRAQVWRNREITLGRMKGKIWRPEHGVIVS